MSYPKFFEKPKKVAQALMLSVVASLVASAIFLPIENMSSEQEAGLQEKRITFKSMSAPFPNQIASHLAVAIDSYNYQRPKEALIHLESLKLRFEASDTSPQQKGLLYALIGACYMGLSNSDAAIENLHASVGHYESVWAHKMLSELYYQRFKNTQQQLDLENHKTHSDKAFELKTSFLRDGHGFERIALGQAVSLPDKNGKTYVISVGVNQYSNPHMQKLRYAESDSDNFASYFSNGSLDNVEIISVKGSAATKFHVRDVVARVRDEATIDDSIVFYFSGHGTADYLGVPASNSELDELIEEFSLGSDGRYLLLQDSDIENVRETSLSLFELASMLGSAKTASPPLLVVDACYTNSVIEDHLKSGLLVNQMGNSGSEVRVIDDRSVTDAVILSSSYVGQLAGESSEILGGIFTHHFLRELRSKETGESGLDISLMDLARNSQENIGKYLEGKSYLQTLTIVH